MSQNSRLRHAQVKMDRAFVGLSEAKAQLKKWGSALAFGSSLSELSWLAFTIFSLKFYF